MTTTAVLQRHLEDFNKALERHDLRALEGIYAEEYMLVRPDGSVLHRDGVLNDLRNGGLRFHSIDVSDLNVRIHDSVGILTAEGRAVSRRGNVESDTHFRFIAIYLERDSSLELIHFQSTSLSA